MNIRILITILILMMSFNSQADVCITEVLTNASYSDSSDSDPFDQEMLFEASLTCQELNNINTGMQAVSIALSAGGIYAACTGVGLPATVAMEGGALALTAIGLVVTNLPCEDTDTDEKIKKRVDEAVCTSLEAQGLSCTPPLTLKDQDIFSI